MKNILMAGGYAFIDVLLMSTIIGHLIYVPHLFNEAPLTYDMGLVTLAGGIAYLIFSGLEGRLAHALEHVKERHGD